MPARSSGGCCSPTTSTPSRPATTPARLRHWPVTPRSTAGRPKRRLLRATTSRFAQRLGQERPRVLVVDDFHWADPSSLPVVEAFARDCVSQPLLLLVGTRPGGLPGWANLEHVERIDLWGLDREATCRLATAIAGHEPTDETTELLRERTAGNPLFIGEIVRALMEAGVLGVRDNQLAITDPGRVDLLPLGLRALLGARIDALASGPRALLGVASVIGMRFGQNLLDELSGAPVAPGDLVRLVEAGLIEAGDVERSWRFAHPLIHDAAYVGLLGARRRRLHARLADLLERDAQTVDVGRLARHRAAAGDAARAIPLLEQAAAEAVAIGALIEAAGFWRRASELSADPREREAFAARADTAMGVARGLTATGSLA